MNKKTTYTKAALLRYATPKKALGKTAQKKIENTTVGIIGLGGVGGYSALLCSQAGFDLVVADFDVVEEKNLARQSLYLSADVGKPKATVAAPRLSAHAPASKVIAVAGRITQGNLATYFGACNIILDCTDNFETRKAIEDYCTKTGKPWVYASATNWEAMAALVVGGKKILPGTEPKKKKPATVNAACTMAASLQVRLLYDWLQKGKLANKIYYFDLTTMQLASRRL